MSDEWPVQSITVDAARNRLTLHLDAELTSATTPAQLERATLDIGTGGRLLGVELADRYLTVAEAAPADTALARGVPVPAELHADAGGRLAAVTIPRRGTGFEITYPSGNR